MGIGLSRLPQILYSHSIRYNCLVHSAVHRADFTPTRLHRMNPSHSSECWRYSQKEADFSHIFWSCPIVTGFSLEMIAIITTFISTSVPQAIKICLLGLVDYHQNKCPIGRFFIYLLFQWSDNFKMFYFPSLCVLLTNYHQYKKCLSSFSTSQHY